MVPLEAENLVFILIIDAKRTNCFKYFWNLVANYSSKICYVSVLIYHVVFKIIFEQFYLQHLNLKKKI